MSPAELRALNVPEKQTNAPMVYQPEICIENTGIDNSQILKTQIDTI